MALSRDSRPLKVCIDARLEEQRAGGTLQFVIGIASGLAAIEDGSEEYSFLTMPEADSWLRPYLSERMRIIHAPAPDKRPAIPGERFLKPIARVVRDAAEAILGARMISIPKSDGIIEREGIEVMHFPTQLGFITNIPTIYQPWDLQHLHYPALFNRHNRLEREIRYRAYCEQAKLVVVASDWTRRDVIAQYQLPAEKVAVVPIAPATNAYADPDAALLAATRTKFALPPRFLFYPAQTWKHKNHLRLIDAVARLLDEDVRVHIVCSGKQNEHFPAIRRRAEQLGVLEQFHFLGFITPEELKALYELSVGVVFPSLFEGGGLPVLEAFAAKRALACSNATCLPALAADGALLFDPNDSNAMAEAMRVLWTDEETRRELVRNAGRRLGDFAWERSAALFRAHYRRIAGRQLTAEDRELLAAPVTT